MPQPHTTSNGAGLPGILLAVALTTVVAAFVALAVSFFTPGLGVTYTAVVLSVAALALLGGAHVAARRGEEQVERPAG